MKVKDLIRKLEKIDPEKPVTGTMRLETELSYIDLDGKIAVQEYLDQVTILISDQVQ